MAKNDPLHVIIEISRGEENSAHSSKEEQTSLFAKLRNVFSLALEKLMEKVHALTSTQKKHLVEISTSTTATTHVPGAKPPTPEQEGRPEA